MHRPVWTTLPAVPVGTDFADVPNFGDSHKLLSINATLVTSATVVNRFPHLQLVDRNGNVFYDIAAGTAQAASQTVHYQFTADGVSAPQGTVLVDNLVSMPLPNFWAPPQFKWQAATTALQVGDQWSAISIYYLTGEEWEHLVHLEELTHLLSG
jgi:hypothetical protein